MQPLLGGGEAGEEVAGDADEDRRPGLGEVGEPVAVATWLTVEWVIVVPMMVVTLALKVLVQALKTGSEGALTITRYSRFDDEGMARKPAIRIAPPNGLSSAVKVEPMLPPLA